VGPPQRNQSDSPRDAKLRGLSTCRAGLMEYDED